jgi:hypothetical protein
MFQTKKVTAAPVDKIEDVAPRINAELMPKLVELGRERAALLVEGRELALISKTHDAAIDGAREIRVAEILGRIPPQPKPNRTGRMAEITTRVSDIDAAIEVLQRDIETERNRAATIIRDRTRPVYGKAVGDLCRAIVGLHEANVAYHAVKDALADQCGGLGTLGNYESHAIGGPRDPQSPIARLVKDAVAEGFFPSRDIPAEFLA